jgi:hypothetical protein
MFRNEEIVNKKIIKMFAKCYEEMYQEKNMVVTLGEQLLKKYIDAKCLYISVAYVNEEPMVFHSYINCGEKARLWHSCSTFRDDKSLATLIGRANKRLHWEDMLFFKELGLKSYDWGGIFDYESANGIDLFKLAFGSDRKDYYNAVVAQSLIGKAYLKLKDLKNICETFQSKRKNGICCCCNYDKTLDLTYKTTVELEEKSKKDTTDMGIENAKQTEIKDYSE